MGQQTVNWNLKGTKKSLTKIASFV